MPEPSYLKLYREGVLQERAREAVERLRECRLCPRECRVNRLEGEHGVCQTGRKATVSSFGPHYGEESPLVGSHGSGTVFFSACNLLCTFCQNYDISHLREGAEVEPGKLAAVMLHLARGGCHNINFVTPSHVVPQILEALIPAVEGGLDCPAGLQHRRVRFRRDAEAPRRGLRHLHARLQVLGQRVGETVLSCRRLPRAGHGGAPGDAPAGGGSGDRRGRCGHAGASRPAPRHARRSWRAPKGSCGFWPRRSRGIRTSTSWTSTAPAGRPRRTPRSTVGSPARNTNKPWKRRARRGCTGWMTGCA